MIQRSYAGSHRRMDEGLDVALRLNHQRSSVSLTTAGPVVNAHTHFRRTSFSGAVVFLHDHTSEEEIHMSEAIETSLNYRQLCHGEIKRIPGLCCNGRITVVDGKTVIVDEGVFDTLIRSAVEEWSKIKNSIYNDTVKAVRRKELFAKIREACYAYGAKQGFNKQTTLNYIILSSYKSSNRMSNLLRQSVLLEAFGEDIIKNIRMNIYDEGVAQSKQIKARRMKQEEK